MIKELPQPQFFKLKGLFAQIIKEMNGPITAAEAIVNFDRAAKANYLKIFTDDFDNPKHCLIISFCPGMIHSGMLAIINMIYSSPQERNQITLKAMLDISYNFADTNKCDAIIGSAWKYKGARGIDSMWINEGFEHQETVYIKYL